MLRLRLPCRAAALCLLACAAALSAAAEPSVEQRLDALTRAVEAQRVQLDAQAAEIAELRTQLADARAPAASTPSTEAHASEAGVEGPAAGTPPDLATLEKRVRERELAAQDAPKLAMVGGRPTLSSADGRSSVSLRAVVQLDAAHYDQAPEGTLATDFRRGSVGGTNNREIASARDLSDGAYFRRARLGFEGVIARDYNFRFMAEFGGSGSEGPARINDAWINYAGFAPFTFQLGAFTPPANLEDATSQEELLFPERSTPSELSCTLGGADGRIGVAVRGAGPRWSSSLALTTRTVGDAEVADSQLALVGRLGFLALASDDYNVHVGGAGTYDFHPPDAGSSVTTGRHGMRLRDRPELRVDSTRLIDTGVIDAEDAWNASLELAANWKSFFVQAERFWYGVDRAQPSALADPRFDAFYVMASWVLTGESHRYNPQTGSFQMPRPFSPAAWRKGLGAWEIALRYSHTDLDFRAGAPGTAAALDAVRGGTQDVWTAGLNWYLSANFRMSLDYYRVDVERLNPAGPGNPTPFGAGASTPPVGVDVGQEIDVYELRSQFNF